MSARRINIYEVCYKKVLYEVRKMLMKQLREVCFCFKQHTVGKFWTLKNENSCLWSYNKAFGIL